MFYQLLLNILVLLVKYHLNVFWAKLYVLLDEMIGIFVKNWYWQDLSRIVKWLRGKTWIDDLKIGTLGFLESWEKLTELLDNSLNVNISPLD